MTNEEMKTQIEGTAKAARRAGCKITLLLNWGRETEDFDRADEIIVSHGDVEGEYHFRYSEAEELKREALQAAEKFDVEPEDYILWVSQGW